MVLHAGGQAGVGVASTGVGRLAAQGKWQGQPETRLLARGRALGRQKAMASTIVQKIAEAHAAVNSAGGCLTREDDDYLDEMDRPLALEHLAHALDALEAALAAAGGTEADQDAANLAYNRSLIGPRK
jgi:hypothetical protein